MNRYILKIEFKNGEVLTEDFNAYKSIEEFLIPDETVRTMFVTDIVRHCIVYQYPLINVFRIRNIDSLAYLDKYFYNISDVKKWFDNECNISNNWIVEHYDENSTKNIINI